VRGFEPVIWTIRVISGVLGLERSRLGLTVGDHATLNAALLDETGKPTGHAPPDLRWSSDRPQVAAVGPDGLVQALTPGHALLTVTAPWGKSDTADVYAVGDLLVSSNRSGGVRIYQLRLVAPDTLYPVLVDGSVNLQAVYSPDRTRIAFSSNRQGSFDLYLMDADGRNLRQLTSDPGNEGEPAWTPDGTRLVYTATARGGPPQLFTIGVDGADQRPLTSGGGGNSSPDVSADGRRVLFVSSRDGNAEIYQLTLQSGEQQRLTRSPARESNPRFLPNGDVLYVEGGGSRSKGSRILRLHPGGTGTVITETKEPIASLDVSADGERLVFVAGRLTDPAKGKAQFTLAVHRMTPGSAPAPVPLRPGEQVLSPSF
jgi:Tol biopolymer transport system component